MEHMSLQDANAVEAVLVTDGAGWVTSVNCAFCLMLEYAKDDVLHKSFPLLATDQPSDSTNEANIMHALQDNLSWQGEYCLSKKSGDLLPVFLSISACQDPQGGVNQYVYSFVDISDKKHQENLLSHQASHDELTDLRNRGAFHRLVEEAVNDATAHRLALAVISIDIDRFGQVNQALGYHHGDLLLKSVATRLKHFAGDNIARLGNDEFAILVMNDDAHFTFDDYLVEVGELFTKPFFLEQHEVFVTAGVGASIFPVDGKTAAELIQSASTAMHYAKTLGDNKFQCFEVEMQGEQQLNLAFEAEIRQALKQGQFAVFYQPVIDVHTKKIIAVEAMLRWHHPDKGLLCPDDFMDACETSGLIMSIDRWVLSTACKQVKAWQSAGYPGLTLNVNLSGKQFLSADIVDVVKGALADSSLAPQYLQLEVLESFIMQEIAHCHFMLNAVDALGVTLAIDHFGTGYSSLGYLANFPFKTIKINQAFLDNRFDNPRLDKITGAIFQLAHALEITTVGEGVETQEQLLYLKGLGCHCIQGYIFAEPLSSEEFIRFQS